MREDNIGILFGYLRGVSYRNAMERLKQDVMVAEEVKIEVAFLMGLMFGLDLVCMQLDMNGIEKVIEFLRMFRADKESVMRLIGEQLE